MSYPELTTVFQPYLLKGESILWTGKPNKWLRFGIQEAIYIAIMGFWVFMIFQTREGRNNQAGPPLLFKILIPIILGGNLIKLLIWPAVIRSQMQYAVTNQRVLIRKGIFSKDFVSLDPRKLRAIELRENKSGIGTIYFLGPDDEIHTGFFANFRRLKPQAYSFEAIAEAASVHKLVSLIKRGENEIPTF